MELNNLAIKVSGLSYTYDGEKVPVLKNVHLQVPAGSRFGLFGPNGAGKTTLMNCLSGILNTDQGKIEIEGEEINKHEKKVKASIGLVPQDFAFYHELSPIENLEFFAAMYGLEKKQVKDRCRHLIQLLGLDTYSNKPLHQLSGGFKRRVNLAIAVLHEPKILFLDEPTVGVDVNTRREIISFLKGLNAKGTTLFYTSHQLSEAQELCDHVALINAGAIIAEGALEDLLKKHAQPDLETLFVQQTQNTMHA